MSILHVIRRLAISAGTLCFPPHCAHCRANTDPGIYVCDTCVADLRPLQPPFCQRCSWPFDGAITEEFVCGDCRDRKVHFDCAVAAYLSRGVVRDLIHGFKYERKSYLRVPLGALLRETLADPRIEEVRYDAFVPVPLHHVRFREREFNQAEELCAYLTTQTGTPTWNVLKRVRYTTTQTQLSREERMENLRGAFQVRHTADVKGRDLVLVDDVFTTGSTVEECSRVLRRAGAASVRVITIARG